MAKPNFRSGSRTDDVSAPLVCSATGGADSFRRANPIDLILKTVASRLATGAMQSSGVAMMISEARLKEAT
jgi:hypothetical protein